MAAPAPGPPPMSPVTPIHALIIGNCDYGCMPQLRGAKKDGDDLSKLLTERAPDCVVEVLSNAGNRCVMRDVRLPVWVMCVYVSVFLCSCFA